MLAEVAVGPRVRRGFWGWLWLIIRKNPSMVAGIAVIFLLMVISIAAPLITSQSPGDLQPIDKFLSPSTAHWFGTDQYGRDVFARTIYGGRVSLVVGFTVASLTMVFGAAVGLVAGYYRRADMIIMRVMDGLMSIPTILLAIALVAILGASITNVIIALTVVQLPRETRLVRGNVLYLRELLYVDAARAVGVPPWRILLLHVFPGSMAPLIIQATFTCATAILVEASLSFLGAGTPPDVASWGNIMAEGRNYIRIAMWIILFPGIFLATMVIAVNLAGDGLRDMLDPRISHRA